MDVLRSHQIVNDRTSAGSFGLVVHFWWLFTLFAFGTFWAAYATWRVQRHPTSTFAQRFHRLKDSPLTVVQVLGFGLICGAVPIIGLVQADAERDRLRDGNFLTWTGMLTNDEIHSFGAGRRPRDEVDLLTVGGMRFTVTCFEPLGPHRLHDRGSCPPFRLGDRLTVLYVPLSDRRYRLAALQIRKITSWP